MTNEKQERYPRGTKVEAVVAYDDKNVWFLGEGTYQGLDMPKWLGGHTDEKLVMASGDVIYAGECIWGPRGNFKSLFKDKTVHRARVIRDEKGIYRGYKEEEAAPAVEAKVEETPTVEVTTEVIAAEADKAKEKDGFLQKLGFKK